MKHFARKAFDPILYSLDSIRRNTVQGMSLGKESTVQTVLLLVRPRQNKEGYSRSGYPPARREAQQTHFHRSGTNPQCLGRIAASFCGHSSFFYATDLQRQVDIAHFQKTLVNAVVESLGPNHFGKTSASAGSRPPVSVARQRQRIRGRWPAWGEMAFVDALCCITKIPVVNPTFTMFAVTLYVSIFSFTMNPLIKIYSS